MNKKNLFYWSLYDFANSFVFINFLLYFSQWLVIDGGLSDFWYNAIFAISSVILLFSGPTLASFTDKFGGRKHFLKFSTFGTILGYRVVTLLASWNHPMIFIAICFLIGQYFYQLSFIFHNPMIEDVADINHRARASGICQFSNSLGQLMGLVLSLFFSKNRLASLLPSIIIFFLLSLPILIYFKEQQIRQAKLSIQSFSNGSKEFFRKLVIFFSVSVAVPVLVAFFFFNDALLTASNNYSIYMERVFSIPDMTKNIILMTILIMSALGGLTFGKIADRIGALKSIKIILITWIVLFPGLGLVKTIPGLIICSTMLGFTMGGMVAVVRAYLSQKLKKEEFGYGFSFYTLFERFSTFFGPLTWGGSIAIFGTSATSYRITMIFMTVYIVIGFLVIQFWKIKQRSTNLQTEQTSSMI